MPLPDPDVEKFERAFRLCLQTMFAVNSRLLVRNLKEECINCALLFILRDVFHGHFAETKDLSFDLEYDKIGANPKRSGGMYIRPDILIHKRGNNKHNFLYLEVKKAYTIENDRKKARNALKSPYNYKYSVLLSYLPSAKCARYKIMVNGEEAEWKKLAHEEMTKTFKRWRRRYGARLAAAAEIRRKNRETDEMYGKMRKKLGLSG